MLMGFKKTDPILLTAEADDKNTGIQVDGYAVCEKNGHFDLVIIQREFTAGQTYKGTHSGEFTPQVKSYEVLPVVPGMMNAVHIKSFITAATLVRLMTEAEKTDFMNSGLLKREPEPPAPRVIPAHEAAQAAVRCALGN